MTAYYNEHDPYAAQWLRNLIDAGHIAPGVVDERSIHDLRHEDLAGFDQCHFFAGIGVWSRALRSAGWPDDRPVWTGSCPCQPFSAAGQRRGADDERHLWPVFYRLIAQRRPPVVLGEQVSSKDGMQWLDLVSANMEASGYAVGAADLCAAGFGGAHLRQRLYFVGLADADAGRQQGQGQYRHASDHPPGNDRQVNRTIDDGEWIGVAGGLADSDSRQRDRITASKGREPDRQATGREQGDGGPADDRRAGGLADAGCAGDERCFNAGDSTGETRPLEADTPQRQRGGPPDRDSRPTGGLEHPDQSGQHGRASSGEQPLCDERDRTDEGPDIRDPRQARSLDDVDWLLCRNPAGQPSWRPVEPGTFPLAHGAAHRMGKLRAYGNALDAETAAGFVAAVMECMP